MKETLLKIMPDNLSQLFGSIPAEAFAILEELRFRTNKPLVLVSNNKEYGLNRQGICHFEKSYVVTSSDVQDILKFISGFSLYALEDELKQGYITIEGGHRIGLVGKVILEDKKVKTLKHIGAINIRIAHQVIGCSDLILPHILEGNRLCHTLIISPPKCGKTTLLRDIIRNLSYGYKGHEPYTVGVVDERSEIAGCYQGVAQNDLGPRTDVLDSCPKVEGMRMLLRSMAPHIIAVDEIGTYEDALAIEDVLGAGISILCTAHGKDLADCYKKAGIQKIIQQKMIERIIVLSHNNGPCTIETIINTSDLQMEVISDIR